MDEFLFAIGIIAGVIVGLALLITTIAGVICGIGYINDMSIVNVELDGIHVYFGMNKHVAYGQLGENGNRYYVKEYRKGFLNMFFEKVENRWIGKDLVVFEN